MAVTHDTEEKAAEERGIACDSGGTGPSDNQIPALRLKTEASLLAIILILGLGLRLWRFDAPPVDYHSFRQTQTLMVARNFFRDGMNLFTPAVDFLPTDRPPARRPVGGTELCIVPYLTAMLYFVFGVRHWVGRVIPLLFALLGTVYFHRLVRRAFGPSCALLGSLLLTFSPFFFLFGRAQMPESFAYAMAFAALYYYERWLSQEQERSFVLAVVFTLLMLLGKPQLAVLALPMCCITLLHKGWGFWRMPRLYLFGALTALPAGLYVWYSSTLTRESGVSFALPQLLMWQLAGEGPYWTKMAHSVWKWSVGPVLCCVAASGLLIRPRDVRGYLPHAWLTGALALLVLAPGGNESNSYYQMIFAPAAIMLAGNVLVRLLRSRRWRVVGVALLLLIVGDSANEYPGLLAPSAIGDQRCGTWIQANTADDALVLCAGESPATLYFADRMGWICWFQNYGEHIVFGQELVETVRKLGASIVAIPDPRFNDSFSGEYSGVRDQLYDIFKCHDDDEFTVFFLRQDAELCLPKERHVDFGTSQARKYLRGAWGPDQHDPDNGPFVPMGPLPVAGIRFKVPGDAARVTLRLASVVGNQRVLLGVAGQPPREFLLPQPYKLTRFSLDLPPDSSGRVCTLSLRALHRNPAGAALALYGMTVGP